jgi:hypothetical protein
MARKLEDFEIDPVVVPVDDDPVGDFREWLSTRPPLEPLAAGVSGATAVRELRDESER